MARRPKPSPFEVFKKRVLSVKEESLPKWGLMSIEECIEHLCETYEVAFGIRKLKVAKSVYLQNPITRWLVIESPFSWGNGLRTPANFSPKPPMNLEAAKGKLLLLLEKSFLSDCEFASEHPVMGELSKDQWKKFLVRHLDFHLKHFSV